MNHWTSEQDKRQLEMWSDRHPVVSGMVTLVVLPFYAVMIVCGLATVVAMNVWGWLHWLPKGILCLAFWFTVIVFTGYWALYGFLWLCGKLLAGGV